MIVSTLLNPKEKRVAIIPETVEKYIKLGFQVILPSNSGKSAGFCDEDYQKAGAIISDEEIREPAIYLCVKSPDIKDVPPIAAGSFLIALFSPFQNAELIKSLTEKGITLCALEKIPRITRAQSMDVLSSQANIAGYKAAIEAMSVYERVIPLMMTAAGTIRPARALILGAGVAGLQAIATVKRMGAKVSAFDVRRTAKEQVESLGAIFVEVDEGSENGESSGGYAKEMSEDYKKKQAEKLSEVIKQADIVITTAQIPGKPAPRLVTKEMVQTMPYGSVIIDMAVETGGNCELSEKDKIVEVQDVKIIGYSDFAARVPNDSSRLFARNVFNFVSLMTKDDSLDTSDEIIQATLIKC